MGDIRELSHQNSTVLVEINSPYFASVGSFPLKMHTLERTSERWDSSSARSKVSPTV